MNNANKNLRNIINKYHGDSELIIEACEKLANEKINTIDDFKHSIFLTDYNIETYHLDFKKYPYLYVLIKYFIEFEDIKYLSLNDVLKFIHSDSMYDKSVIKNIEKELIQSKFNGIKLYNDRGTKNE